jgi:pimeloyl-ACP methyl ester carboxylesterase
MTPPIIEAVTHAAPGGEARILLVMLPGYGMGRDDFARHGFISALHERGWPVDVVAAEPDVDLYLDGSIAERLDADIVGPARRAGRRLWFLGVSLGALGALLYAQRHQGAVTGAILLAPFLGNPGLIAEVAAAGGLERWDPGAVRSVDVERQLLAWLKAKPPGAPALHVGYGRGDRFARAAALLAGLLPQGRTIVTEGGHDWPTWRRLWRETLDRDPFALAARTAKS